MTISSRRARQRKPARPLSARALARTIAGLILAVAIGVPALLTAPAASAATGVAASTPRAVALTPAGRTDLTRAFERGRKVAGSAIAGIRPGSVHVAQDAASRRSWALATFTPSGRASGPAKESFQDGGGTALFTRTAGQPWRLSRVLGAPYYCSNALTPALRAAWHLSRPASCAVRPAAARQSARAAESQVRSATRQSAAAGTAAFGAAIAKVALNQVGVQDVPDVLSFDGVDCDPYSTMDGPPTPNANGCGVNQNFHLVNEDEEWCSDLAKWVWQQAGVTADISTLNAGADSFYAWGAQQGETLTVDSGSPAVGDAVVFYEPGAITTGTYADHVGIVTGVNPDGTINMVNGDFLGSTNISVQYNTDVTLSTWAAEVWGAGEQWVFVAPPDAAQQPAPTAHIVAARNAVTGAQLPFAALAAERGGSISSYLWTFGDGVTATGRLVSHVFGDPGLYTVTMTATSSFGTATTSTWNIDVVSPSSAVASTQSDQVWYTSTPLLQDLYRGSPSSGLTEEFWDGASWLDQQIPGQPSSSYTAALNYPAANDALEPQVFFRAADGTLAQTSGGDGNWSSSELTGQPAAASAIVATTVNDPASPRGAAPVVFYFDSSGRLSESSGVGGSWTSQVLPVAPTSQPSSLALADATLGGAPRQEVFYLHSGQLTVATSGTRGWRTRQIRSSLGIAAGSSLAALTSGPDGLEVGVFFIDRAGQPAVATSADGAGAWVVRQLPGPAAGSGGLTAVSYQLADGSTTPEVFYADTAGQPVQIAAAGPAWHSTVLPGQATSILGAAAFPAAGGPQRLFVADQGAVTEDASATAGGSWTASSLPTRPASYSDRIMLYAASPGDDQTALTAAAAAGLPAAQVTDNFDVAWAATLSPDYVVIAVGVPAVDALYVNDCGWPDPSGDDAGTTPFYYYLPPFYGLPGADAYLNATAASPAQAVAAATDATYYALHDALPPGVTSIPTLTGPDYSCEGSPS